MKQLISTIFLLVPMLTFGQKMISSSEWCAHNKQANVLPPNALDGRSDSIDLTHAWITLDLSDAASKNIAGNCRWSFKPILDGVEMLRFDLLGLSVDSVVLNNSKVGFSQIGEQISIPMLPAPAAGSINSVIIYYHGSPEKDASGWGGFYFDGEYAFNLGVGFDADPHVFGRAWFPCFDNFVERSTYTFDMYTTPTQPAYCNGYMLTDEPTMDGKRRRLWLLNQPIPSYLASVAIGPYTSFKRSYAGQNNMIPLEIAAAAADTAKVRNTFQHMGEAIEAFEFWYGPYKWPRIGFSLVPFNSGAMEHATNVAIGRAFINGTLNFETLWAHELSHHWWGDLATCSTAEDMWLNEGWASYSEHLFTEWVYGETAFREAVRVNFLDVLQNSHLNEGGYRAVSGIPHDLTYGSHVYNKGAVVAHNLRGYLGDTLFRQGIRAALDETNFQDWSSAGFRDKLEASTGIDLHDFFDDWVFAGGFPDFLIDSVIWQQGGPFGLQAIIHVKQKLRGAPDFHQNVPLELDMLYPSGHRFSIGKHLVSGENSVITLSFAPFPNFEKTKIWVNTNQRLLQARSEGERMLKNTGGTNFQDAKFNLTVNALGSDSVLFRVEHHFSTPDIIGANPNNYHISTRFWEILGDFPTGFDAQAIVLYDGRGQFDKLDSQLFAAHGSSETDVVLLYRPGAGHPWQEWPTYTQSTLGTNMDGYGQLRPTNLKAGQYTIGKGATSAVKTVENPFGKLLAAPNPTSDKLQLSADKAFDNVDIIREDGTIMLQYTFEKTRKKVLSIKSLTPGQYWLRIRGSQGSSSIAIIKL